MRMWCVEARVMCRSHLLAEHLELHMFHTAIMQGKSLTGYITGGKLDPFYIHLRHEELVEEMKRRGWTGHKTPLENFDVPEKYHIHSTLDSVECMNVLYSRCLKCRELQDEAERFGLPSHPDLSLAPVQR